MDYVQVITWVHQLQVRMQYDKNMTKIELEFISDGDVYLLFEKDMSGGVSDISKRYSKVNTLSI